MYATYDATIEFKMWASQRYTDMEQYEIHVRVVEAKDLRKVIVLGKMDVYATLTCRGLTQTSPVAKDGHTAPTFDWKTMLNGTVADQLVLALDHKNSVSSDVLIGRCITPVANYMDGAVSDKWYSLQTQEGGPAGQVRMRVQITKMGEKPLHPPAAIPKPAVSAPPQQQAYQNPPPAYTQPVPTYQHPPPAYPHPPPTYQQPPPAYPHPPPAYQQPPPAYPQPPPAYQQQPVYQYPYPVAQYPVYTAPIYPHAVYPLQMYYPPQ